LYYFYNASLAAFVSNLFAIPLVAAGTNAGLWLGIVGGWIPFVDAGVACVSGWSAQGLAFLAREASSWTWGRIFLWPGTEAWVLTAYAAGIAWRAQVKVWLVTACLAGLLIGYGLQRPPALAAGELRATFLSLGIGESALVETSVGARVLIDTGSESEFLWRVKPFLAKHGINRLDALILSHGDDDHAGGLTACLQCFRPKYVLSAKWPLAGRETAQALLDRGHGSACSLRQGDHLELAGPLAVSVLWPPSTEVLAGNADSLVVELSGPGGSLLFTGDSPMSVERRWWFDSPVKVLKAAHHGSRKSTGEDLLRRAQPEAVVVMPGTRNPFGFPNEETMIRLRRSAPVVLDGMAQGAAEVTIAKDGKIRWKTWR